jgi:hypothetical protein
MFCRQTYSTNDGHDLYSIFLSVFQDVKEMELPFCAMVEMCNTTFDKIWKYAAL